MSQASLPIGYTSVPGNSTMYLSGNSTSEWGYLDVPPGTYNSLTFRVGNLDGNYGRNLDINFDNLEIYLSTGYANTVRPLAEINGFRYSRYRTGPFSIQLQQAVPPFMAPGVPEPWNITLNFDRPFYFGGGVLYIKLITGNTNFQPYRIPLDAVKDPWPVDPGEYTYVKTYVSTQDGSGGVNRLFPYSSWMYVTENKNIRMGCNLPYFFIGPDEIGILSIGVARQPLPYILEGNVYLSRIEPLITIPVTSLSENYSLGHYHDFLVGTTLGSYVTIHDSRTGELKKVSLNHYYTINKIDLTETGSFGSNNLLYLGYVQAPMMLLN